MSDKLRSVNTRFWEDTFIESLNISDKLLFLYLLTNTQTNLLGIYEISLKRISYDTGLNKDSITKAFERFGKVRKAYFINNFVILPNFLKNQRLNKNMKIGVAKIFNELPNWLKENILQNNEKEISNDSKGFEMVRNGLVKYEIEIESEKEIEIESEEEEKKDIPTLENFKDYAFENKNNIALKAVELKYKSWVENDWKDGNNKKIKNWKSKLLNTLTYLPENGKFQNNKTGNASSSKTNIPSNNLSTKWSK